MTLFIGFQDHIRDGNIKVTTRSGFDGLGLNTYEKLLDGLHYTYARTLSFGAPTINFRNESGGDLHIDYIALIGHNLGSVGQSWASGFSAARIFPTNNGVSLDRINVDIANNAIFNVNFSNENSQDNSIARIAIGTFIKLPHVPTPLNIPLYQPYQNQVNKSDKGRTIGISTREIPFDFDLQLRNLTPDWVENNAKTLLEGISKHPFFVYDSSGVIKQSPLCWLIKPNMQVQINANHLYDIDIKSKARLL